MDAIRQYVRALVKSESGATAIEYGLIAALIIVAAIGSISALGGGAGGMWTKIDAKVAAAMA